MTKTLTEQWREGTLPEGCYYVRFLTTKQPHIEICGSEFLGNLAEFNGTDRAEVLAPVPSYKEYNKLRKLPLKCFQLEEDNSALVVINKDMCKTIERLQEQLKEANEIISIYRIYDDTECGKATEYCKKWGVK